MKRAHEPGGGPPGDGDRGDIVLGWLTKVTATLAVLGLIGFDAISLGVGRLLTEDRAATAAREAVSAYRDSSDVQRAYDAAVASLEHPDSLIDPQRFTVAKDGTVTLTVTSTAPTLLVEKVGPIRDWAVSTATTTARPAT